MKGTPDTSLFPKSSFGRKGKQTIYRLFTYVLIVCVVGNIIYYSPKRIDLVSRLLSFNQSKSSSHLPSRCALLFFGLPKMFESHTLPSIQRYIIERNPTCDVFLHTYDIKSISTPRNNEAAPINPHEVYLLTKNVLMDTIEDFERVRDLDYFRLYHFKRWGECCQSTDNMIKQWHSIEAVWKMMEQYGIDRQKELGDKSSKDNPYYERVGLFRSDVLYLHPIDITDGNAVIPSFGSNKPGRKGVCDRMFYGLYKYAKAWAAGRFRYYDHYERGQVRSENFVYGLLKKNKIPFKTKNICFWRLRADNRVSVQDCMVNSKWAEGHAELLDGLTCQKWNKDDQFPCSVLINRPGLLQEAEELMFKNIHATI